MIQKLEAADLEEVLAIWLEGNREAHDFIPESYWQDNLELARQQIPASEVFLYKTDIGLAGFVGLTGKDMEKYIAGLFVRKEFRSRGIGKELLDEVKRRYPTLTLDVFAKNIRARKFYEREGFAIVQRRVDEKTGVLEFTMEWQEKPEVKSVLFSEVPGDTIGFG